MVLLVTLILRNESLLGVLFYKIEMVIRAPVMCVCDTDYEILPSFAQFSLNFKFNLFEFPWVIGVSVILSRFLYLKLLENAKDTLLYIQHIVLIHIKMSSIDISC